jgi:probable addiction module antidote protein
MVNKNFNDGWEKFEVETFRSVPIVAKLCLENEIEEYNKTGDMTYLRKQLRSMAKAYGWNNLEKETKLTRATLHNILNGKSNPKLNSFLNIINALGFRISMEPLRA